MVKLKSEQITRSIFDLAGIEINGKNPWDIYVHNHAFFEKVLAQGSLGLGESYMDGWWDCAKLDEFFYRVFEAGLDKKVKGRGILRNILKFKLMNLQSKKGAFKVGEQHYDIGNELYQHMLDKRMVYSCGYWKDANNLDAAQEAKLDLTCRKTGLKPGMKVLDIGCGWGSFAKYAAKEYKVKVVGITVSKKQLMLGNELCKGLPVEIKLLDYRDVNEKFDAIVSLGMFEHVGPKNYGTYMKVVRDCLKDNGLFILHTIGTDTPGGGRDRWVDKYIFPNGVLPSAKQIISAAKGLLVLEDWHNFGADYYKTLMAWHDNFEKNWDKIRKNYDKRFKRMWDYYLLSYAGAFRAGELHLWQIVFSKGGVKGRYEPIR